MIIITSFFSPLINMSENISEKVFRMHILANSDSVSDQNLKLKVRDEVLKQTNILFKDCDNKEEAIEVSSKNIVLLKSIVDKTILENGYDYTSRVFVKKEFFNTREYEKFTLPAGNYDCLKIEIGQGRGKNWWCVMFPAVCVSGCTEEFDKTLSDEEIKMVESKNKIIKFKAVEIYERIKNAI